MSEPSEVGRCKLGIPTTGVEVPKTYLEWLSSTAREDTDHSTPLQGLSAEFCSASQLVVVIGLAAESRIHHYRAVSQTAGISESRKE